ncbi:unnamed protein product [Amoebophrya sp. A25]|nr:unnamed protein product [Amoebophrya sp. A25]|eukprot:GSA25T00014849001.1
MEKKMLWRRRFCQGETRNVNLPTIFSMMDAGSKTKVILVVTV